MGVHCIYAGVVCKLCSDNMMTIFDVLVSTVLTVMFDPDGYEVSEGETANVMLVTNLPYSFDFSVIVDCENGSTGGM